MINTIESEMATNRQDFRNGIDTGNHHPHMDIFIRGF